MFLIDKYTPKNINEIYFHKEIFELLERMSKDESIPHIIFHGVKGTGKKTMIKIFLEMLFDKTVHNTYEVDYKVTGSSNKVNYETIKKSDYHIIIQPKNTNYDRYLIHDVVKDYAKRTGFEAYQTNRKFKVIQIDELDKFPYYAQTSLRRTIENYSDKCRFIMWCDSLSNVIEPIQSRCTCIRLSLPTEKELMKYVYDISIKENIILKLNDYDKILKKKNLKDCLWDLEFKKNNLKNVNDYRSSLLELVKIIYENNINKIDEARDIIFKISITNYRHRTIIEDLTDIILNDSKFSDKIKILMIIKISEIEHNLIRSRRGIIHFDSLIISLMKIIHDNKKKLNNHTSFNIYR